ncbi:MAG: gas vesicle protein [Acidimicrobiaceae bacterium]|nr:gas vesicle protein [Acidimicrobiaceae bacterium]
MDGGTGVSAAELVDYGTEVTLVDLADRLLESGVVIGGDIVLSLAGIDLVFVSLRALIASVDTAARLIADPGGGWS